MNGVDMWAHMLRKYPYLFRKCGTRIRQTKYMEFQRKLAKEKKCFGQDLRRTAE